MIFKRDKRAINAFFCDFSSSWWPGHEFFDRYGFKWPDNFEIGARMGEGRIQVIEDFGSGLSLYNHMGVLYPFRETRIIERSCKVKESVIVERFGNRNAFPESDVYFLDTGFKSGTVEYMMFKYHKDHSSFTSFREVLYQFPLSSLTEVVLALRERRAEGLSRFADLEKQEKEEITNHQAFGGWEFIQRDISSCEDQYDERLELPLYHYHFQHSEGINVSVRFEYFEG